jgi:Calcineurin-like phosphoesterase
VTVLALAMPSAAPSAPLHRIIAVGDLHGDFSAWRDILRGAKLVDGNGHWTGGDTVLVQTGDVVDRGPDSLKLLRDIMRLQDEAERAHGRVIAMVGNHEAMNIVGDLRYVSPQDFAAYADDNSAQLRDNVFESNKATLEALYHKHDPDMTSDAIKQAWFKVTPLGRLEHQIAWGRHGAIGRWVPGNPAVVLLDGTLFVHGGISPAYARMSIEEINKQVDEALLTRSTDPKAITNDAVGPLWYRGLATPNADEVDGPPKGEPEANASTAPPEPPVEDQLDVLLSGYGAKRIVIGHTVILSGIATLYGGRLIRIDTGISYIYNGTVSYLEILDGTAIPHAVERSSPPAKQGAP